MAKRRSNNEGTIYQKKNGNWRAQLILRGKRLGYTASTQREALEWLRVTKNKVVEGHNFEGGKETLAQFLEGWFTSIQSSRKPETVDLYKRILRKSVVPIMGNIRLTDLTPNHIQRLYNHLGAIGKSSHAIHAVHKILHTALDQAVKLKVLPNNPCNAVEAPLPVQKEMAFLDENQVQTLLLSAKSIGDRYYPLYFLAINTGMRQTELLGLKWKDVDWERKTLTVNRQLIRKNGGGYTFRGPKTRSGTRTIAFGESTGKVLREHQETQLRMSEEKKERWTDLDLVFPTFVGTPIVASNLRTAFRKLLKKTGLPRMRFHDLRHTAASLMLNFGVPLIVVSKRLGHANPSITLNVYGHLIPAMQELAATVMDELLTPVSLPTAPQLHPNCTRKSNKLVSGRK